MYADDIFIFRLGEELVDALKWNGGICVAVGDEHILNKRLIGFFKIGDGDGGNKFFDAVFSERMRCLRVVDGVK